MRQRLFLYAYVACWGVHLALLWPMAHAANLENNDEVDLPAIGPASVDAHQEGSAPLVKPAKASQPIVSLPAFTTPQTPAGAARASQNGLTIAEPKIPDLPHIDSPKIPSLPPIAEPKIPAFVSIASPTVPPLPPIGEPKLDFAKFGNTEASGGNGSSGGGAIAAGSPVAATPAVLAKGGENGSSAGPLSGIGGTGTVQSYERAQAGNVPQLPQIVSTPVLSVPSLPFFGNASTPVEVIPTLPSTSSPIFGQATTPISVPQNIFQFGTPSTPIRQSVSAPVFGTPSTPIQNPQTPFVFGRATTPVPSPLGTPNFGTPSTPLGSPSTPRQAPHTSPSLGVTSSPHNTPNLGVPSTPRGTR